MVSACTVTSGRPVLRGGKGQAAPAVGAGGVDLCGLVEGRVGLGKLLLADEILAVRD